MKYKKLYEKQYGEKKLVKDFVSKKRVEVIS